MHQELINYFEPFFRVLTEYAFFLIWFLCDTMCILKQVFTKVEVS